MYERRHNTRPRKHFDNIIYGIHPILEALQAGKELERLLLSREIHTPQLRDIIRKAEELNVPYQKVPTEKLDSLTQKNHQGVIAFTSLIEYQPLESVLMQVFEQGKTPLLLILDRITDVRNMGAIARSAECAGVDAIIIPAKGSAQINADAVKTSAGALNTVPVHRSENLKNTIKYLKDSGLKIVGVTEKGNEAYYTENFTTPIALILGSEEDGISPEYLKLCDKQVRIPLQGSISSLNVSVATGILLFETVKQRLL